MKRFIAVLLSVIFAVSLSACSFNDVDNGIVPNDGKRDIDIQIVANGTYGADGRTVEMISDVGLIQNSLDLQETLPVYVNSYSYGQEGPLYEVTDALVSEVSSNLARYLGYLYDDFSSQRVQFSSDNDREYEVYYVRNSTEIRSLVNSISILSSEYAVPNNATDAELLDNALVKAAISYLGLSNPVVSKTIEYTADGKEELRVYKITSDADDLLQNALNRSFSCVTVTKYADIDDILVKIGCVDREELVKYKDYQVLAYSDVIAELKSYYPKMDNTDIKAEIYYSATVQCICQEKSLAKGPRKVVQTCKHRTK